MPTSLRKLKKAAKKHGIRLEKPKSGSHFKFVGPDPNGPGELSYPITAHNAERSEVDEIYLKGFCRCFGLDRDEDLPLS